MNVGIEMEDQPNETAEVGEEEDIAMSPSTRRASPSFDRNGDGDGVGEGDGDGDGDDSIRNADSHMTSSVSGDSNSHKENYSHNSINNNRSDMSSNNSVGGSVNNNGNNNSHPNSVSVSKSTSQSLFSVLALEQNKQLQAVEHLLKEFSVRNDRSKSKKEQRQQQQQQQADSNTATGSLDASSCTADEVSTTTDSSEDNSKLIAYNQKAIKTFRRSKKFPLLIGLILNDSVMHAVKRGKYEKVVHGIMEALESYDSKSSSGAPDVFSDVVKTWWNIGECHSNLKDYEKSSNAYLSALGVQRKAKTDDDGDDDDDDAFALANDESVADTLRRIGKVYKSMDSHGNALLYLNEALYIHQRAVDESMDAPDTDDCNQELAEKQDELASTVYCIAEVHDAIGEINDAARMYSDSLQLRMFSDANKKHNKRSNMVHCAMCLVGVGGVHLKKGQPQEAEKVFNEALSYCGAHGLPDNHKIVLMIKQRISKAKSKPVALMELEHRADAQIQERNYDGAILLLSEVMKLRKEALRKLKADGRDLSKERFDTACTLRKFGDVLAMKDDRKNAERAYNDAIKLFRKSGQHADANITAVEEEVRKLYLYV